MKNPLTPAGIEPATFRFVAQHLNHCATALVRQRVLQNFDPYIQKHNLGSRVSPDINQTGKCLIRGTRGVEIKTAVSLL